MMGLIYITLTSQYYKDRATRRELQGWSNALVLYEPVPEAPKDWFIKQ